MGRHILLDYLKQHPETEASSLMNIYAYLKFKAYLQTTLRCTRKAYGVKTVKTLANLRFLPPDELCMLSDTSVRDVSNDFSYDLEWAISRLEPAQADVVKLYYYHGKTDLEIAHTKNVSRQAVNSLKRRALKKLRKYLVQYAD